VDGFRRGLGSAIQWYDCLRIMVDRRVAERLQRAYDDAQGTLKWGSPPMGDVMDLPTARTEERPSEDPGDVNVHSPMSTPDKPVVDCLTSSDVSALGSKVTISSAERAPKTLPPSLSTDSSAAPSPDNPDKVYAKYRAESNVLLQNESTYLASRYLQSRCPACFGGTVWGKTEAQYVIT
jgi:hypothetical protein